MLIRKKNPRIQRAVSAFYAVSSWDYSRGDGLSGKLGGPAAGGPGGDRPWTDDLGSEGCSSKQTSG